MTQITKCRITTNYKTTNKFEPLFKPASDWHNNACLNYGNDVTRNYIDGYKKAADKLVNDMDSHIDLLVYPIVFLYRHHVEISLKEMIESGDFLLGTKFNKTKTHGLNSLWMEVKRIAKEIWNKEFLEKDFEFIDHIIREKEMIESGDFLLGTKFNKTKTHGLNSLWMEVKRIAKEIWNKEFLEKDFEFIDHIIREFEEYDEKSTSFRYAKTNGKKSNPHLLHINIRHLRDMIEKFNEMLLPIDCRISFYLDHVEEFHFRKSNGTL
jgi:hypothetical protein